ncbi:thiamine phosphate synthase [Halobacillus salinus]|uniref:thiamine phosphate synthase n=1 Tax=Halobacillus salinus TaxID=192814 RepID=UPI0009A7B35A|nr:thiamine phosphate synthase [Halobacillus salinus]
MKSGQLRKYLVMGSNQCSRDPHEVLREAIAGGITAFQYREKGNGARLGQERLMLGRSLREICNENDILFFVNDDLELAIQLGADGVHVGQADKEVTYIREYHPELLIGLSVSNETELANSEIDYVDYLGAGPIYPTATKEDAKESVGTDWIRRIKIVHPTIPVVGIGGIDPTNASNVIEAGADGVAVISAITKAVDIKEAVRQI